MLLQLWRRRWRNISGVAILVLHTLVLTRLKADRPQRTVEKDPAQVQVRTGSQGSRGSQGRKPDVAGAKPAQAKGASRI
eukprot:5074713-Amphidinium_carterae.1